MYKARLQAADRSALLSYLLFFDSRTAVCNSRHAADAAAKTSASAAALSTTFVDNNINIHQLLTFWREATHHGS